MEVNEVMEVNKVMEVMEVNEVIKAHGAIESYREDHTDQLYTDSDEVSVGCFKIELYSFSMRFHKHRRRFFKGINSRMFISTNEHC